MTPQITAQLTLQDASPDGGALKAFSVIARLHQVAVDPETLRCQLGKSPSEAVGATDLLLAAKRVGLKAKLSTTATARLALTPLPALALMNDGSTVVLARCDGSRVLVQSFSDADHRPLIRSLEEFSSQWSGQLILFASRASLVGDVAAFDFSWFIPCIVKYRRLLAEVLLVSLCLQLFSLVTPLFFQVVMDKVLVHKSLSTLDVLVVGLVGVVIFESVLAALRNYVFSHTTTRIDVELGSRLYRHLVSLPLSYFQARRVGDSVARVRELENIRSFLTGSALTLVLDVQFSVVFVAIMFTYSASLSLIVLASLPLYVLLSVMVVPVLRARLNEKFTRNAESQSHLVESITGIQTVKAGALEPSFARRWDEHLAAYVHASFRTQTLAGLAHEGVNLIGKLVNAATLWWGTRLVMDSSHSGQEFTVGMFIAFNMFAGRVAQPVMRIAQMWTDFQQTGLSVRRLGDILNTVGETSSSGAAQLPSLTGYITFENVNFRYRPDARPVLDKLDLRVHAGEVIGIVGRSGSGKSTLTKLVQRLHSPEQGRVLIDDIDIALVDVTQLRRQIGVVLQDNFLFNRSVRDNIAVTDPAAPLEMVIHAARLAGAHEFITSLPEGYDTIVGEQGAALSGGQRQRVAIARALFSNPRILIFDEATSALDYESEAAIQKNMAAICKGRTVLIIAHRLSAVRNAHRIIAMNEGRIAEAGPHEALIKLNGLYAHLWRLQAGTDAGHSIP